MSRLSAPLLPYSLLVVTLTLACFVGCAADPDTPSSEAIEVTELELPANFESIEAQVSADDLQQWIRVLSDDAMGGRGPGSPGDEMARTYIAEQMAALGLEPAGLDGSWEQPFSIVGIESELPGVWSFQTPQGDYDVPVGDHYVANSGVQSARAAIDGAELVFVGYGIEAPEYEWNDYKDRDLSGKVLVVLNNDPDWDPGLFEGERRLYYGRWRYKYEMAGAKGAAGAIIIHTTPSAGYGWNVVQTSWTGELFQLPDVGSPRVQIEGWLSEEAANGLLEAAGHDLAALVEAARSPDFEPVDLGITTSLSLSNTIRQKTTANVLGLIRGSDPELAEEFVVYTAHHDHIGDGGAGDDPIYNGALDNAAGVAQLLAIAQALEAMDPKPKRSALFAFVGAEEQGLLGSAFYAQNPTIHPGKLAANINYDGGNIWGRTRDVTFIGYGKSSLDAVVDAAAARQERTVYPDQFPDRGFYYRSDQFNFAKIGVPAIYLDTGTDFVDQEPDWGRRQIEAWERDHYHQVSDEIDDSWVWDGMVQDVRLGLACGVSIADTPALPAWTPGDEFEAARLAALAQ